MITEILKVFWVYTGFLSLSVGGILYAMLVLMISRGGPGSNLAVPRKQLLIPSALFAYGLATILIWLIGV